MKVLVYSSEDTLMVKRVKKLTDRMSLTCMGQEFQIIVSTDRISGQRVYIQLSYSAPCTNGGENDQWRGRKWYLSDFMTDSEIVFTVYAAFEAAVKHEIMEGFKIDGIVLVNPHVNYEELLKISHNEVKRNDTTQTLPSGSL